MFTGRGGRKRGPKNAFSPSPGRGTQAREFLLRALRPGGVTSAELVGDGIVREPGIVGSLLRRVIDECGWDVRATPLPGPGRGRPKSRWNVVGKMRWDGTYRPLHRRAATTLPEPPDWLRDVGAWDPPTARERHLLARTLDDAELARDLRRLARELDALYPRPDEEDAATLVDVASDLAPCLRGRRLYPDADLAGREFATPAWDVVRDELRELLR